MVELLTKICEGFLYLVKVSGRWRYHRLNPSALHTRSGAYVTCPWLMGTCSWKSRELGGRFDWTPPRCSER